MEQVCEGNCAAGRSRVAMLPDVERDCGAGDEVPPQLCHLASHAYSTEYATLRAWVNGYSELEPHFEQLPDGVVHLHLHHSLEDLHAQHHPWVEARRKHRYQGQECQCQCLQHTHHKEQPVCYVCCGVGEVAECRGVVADVRGALYCVADVASCVVLSSSPRQRSPQQEGGHLPCLHLAKGGHIVTLKLTFSCQWGNWCEYTCTGLRCV